MEFLKKYRKSLILLLIVATLGGFILMLMMKRKESKEEEPTQTKKEPYQVEAAKMWRHLIDSGVAPDAAKIIVAQSMHETGKFTSSLFKNYNNAFGMKQPHVRPTTSLKSSPTGFATYASVESSVDDLLKWIEYNKVNPKENTQQLADVRSYTAWLKEKGYYEDTFTNYYSAVQKHYNSIKSLS